MQSGLTPQERRQESGSAGDQGLMRTHRFSRTDFLIRYKTAKMIFPRKLGGFDFPNRLDIILVRTSNNLRK